MEKEVSQLLLHCAEVLVLDRLDQLVRLFQKERLECLLGLLLVPGAAVLAPKGFHQADQFGEFFHILIL